MDPSCRRYLLQSLLGFGLGLGLAGCARPSLVQQRRVNQPDMVFSGSAVWNFDQPLALQTETGRAFTGGGSAAGCTSCK